METEILHQLVWIKWLLVAILVAFLAAVVYLCVAMVFMRKFTEHMKSDLPFPDRLRSLLDEGKTEEVITLAEDRLKKFPADAQAHWFLAQGCYRTGDLTRSLIALRKTQELQPGWEASYTGPLLRVIEQRIGDGKVKADLKVITPNPPLNTDAPPNGGGSVS